MEIKHQYVQEYVDVSDAVLRALRDVGVKHVFGISGSANLGLLEKVPDYDIEFILVRHEQHAAHAADGYGRVSRRPGVALATSGPGATNLVTGIVSAYMDSVPLLAITGQVARNVFGKDAFQETDILGMLSPHIKWAYMVRRPEDAAKAVKVGYYVAYTGRPGPVLVDIPRDLWREKVLYEDRSPEELTTNWLPGYKGAPPRPRVEDVYYAAKVIASSNKPVMLVGGGMYWAQAWSEVLMLAEKYAIPVVTTFTGKNAVPENHPWVLGSVGMHGRVEANWALAEADTVIVIGSRISDRTVCDFDKFGEKKIIHFDIDASEIGKNVEPLVGVVGDVKEALRLLDQFLEKLLYRSRWNLRRLKELREAAMEVYRRVFSQEGRGLKPWEIVKALREVLPVNAIVATGTGAHQMWMKMYFEVLAPGTFLTSAGLGAMGYGFPAALGAKAAAPDRPVVDVDGDGSFLMTHQSLATVVQYNLPVIVVVFNNGSLQLVRQWQDLFFGGKHVWESLEGNPDFVKLAEAYGVEGVRPSSIQEFKEVVRRAVRSNTPLVVDCPVDPDIKVLPMVPPGKWISEILP